MKDRHWLATYAEYGMPAGSRHFYVRRRKIIAFEK
jgi:hypothetical protein